MTILTDRQIMELCKQKGMIEYFMPGLSRPGVISYGLSSMGYDMRIGRTFKVFTNAFGATIDPKNFDPKNFVEVEGDKLVLPGNSFALGMSMEYFRIPRDVLAICLGKSTYARCGVITNFTPFEPEWEGYVTIEISNTSPNPAIIYANEGIAQVLFFRADMPCDVSYADKKGKYQKQMDIVTAKVL